MQDSSNPVMECGGAQAFDLLLPDVQIFHFEFCLIFKLASDIITNAWRNGLFFNPWAALEQTG